MELPEKAEPSSSGEDTSTGLGEEGRRFTSRMRKAIFGAPREVNDPSVFHKMALIPLLAWVGLGADGLSSSSYGPDEAFRALGEHAYLAVFLCLATLFTVLVISWGYSRIIEHFPTGGGGYLVATKLLGPGAGVVSGSALLVDYVLTVTTSIAAGGDALYSLIPRHWSPHLISLLQNTKLPLDVTILFLLIVMNLRGVKESVSALMPIFMLFVTTHIILIVGGIAMHAGEAVHLTSQVSHGLSHDTATLGMWGLFLVFARAYSLGGGTYTGIEAVSNGLQIMREPRVETGKRTMLYMALSLAFTASGILLCYMLMHVHAEEGKTLNTVLAEAFAGHWHIGHFHVGKWFVWVTLMSEGALLFVAAQTGFIDGPRVMANMAVDSWLPHRFASLSDRLTTKDGVWLMGIAAIILLIVTGGSVDKLVVMYAINVFIGFSLSNLGMFRLWWTSEKGWTGGFIHVLGFVLCVGILIITIGQKFEQGAWLTLVITAVLVSICVLTRTHYRNISQKLVELNREFADLPSHDHHGGEPDPTLPTAVLLVGSYGSIGVHSILSIHRMLPNYFKNILFVSAAVIDQGSFKGASEIEELKKSVQDGLNKYVELARRLGWNAGSSMDVGIDPANTITKLCIAISEVYPRVMFFAGKLIWQRESWWQRFLHNETAFQVQRRLQWKGLPMTVIPLRVRG